VSVPLQGTALATGNVLLHSKQGLNGTHAESHHRILDTDKGDLLLSRSGQVQGDSCSTDLAQGKQR